MMKTPAPTDGSPQAGAQRSPQVAEQRSPEARVQRSPEARATRASLVGKLRQLEGELQRAQAELAALGGETIPGLHLIVEAAGQRALLSIGRVQEIVRVVTTTPLPGAPPHVLGTFVCRGAPILAVDLGAVTGAERALGLDAQIVVLAGSPAIGLVVDQVLSLVDGPRLFEGDVAAGTPEGWRGSRLVAGLCVQDQAVLPLLDPTPLTAALREWAP
jgi:purine-binding chemotaxis protein CheW